MHHHSGLACFSHVPDYVPLAAISAAAFAGNALLVAGHRPAPAKCLSAPLAQPMNEVKMNDRHRPNGRAFSAVASNPIKHPAAPRDYGAVLASKEVEAPDSGARDGIADRFLVHRRTPAAGSCDPASIFPAQNCASVGGALLSIWSRRLTTRVMMKPSITSTATNRKRNASDAVLALDRDAGSLDHQKVIVAGLSR